MSEEREMMTTPREMAARGERIYAEKYKQDYEAKYRGQFAAIDVISEKAFVAEFADDVLQKARKAEPAGVFHLIKIGFSGAFRVSSCFSTLPSARALQHSW